MLSRYWNDHGLLSRDISDLLSILEDRARLAILDRELVDALKIMLKVMQRTLRRCKKLYLGDGNEAKLHSRCERLAEILGHSP